MIELVGGPQDGLQHRRNAPDHEVFVDGKGHVRLERKFESDIHYVEQGVCRGCGVRHTQGPLPKARRFVLEALLPDESCRLCGAVMRDAR